jgi:3-phosphoshikimate 1-carboxyvinyltransferase
MEVVIHPSVIQGSITGPASKSSMQRACAAALLAGGETIVKNPGHSNDDLAALAVVQGLGLQSQSLPDGSLRLISHGIEPITDELNCGESGLGIRMFTPIIGLSHKRITITGGGSLKSRPMDFFDENLPKLGISIQSNEGRLPLKVQGPLKPANITIDGSLSSQFLTGLLMAYGAIGAGGVSIFVNNLNSKPYIDLTLKVMGQFGLKVPQNKHYHEFAFDQSQHQKKNSFRTYEVEGDWSGAAFLFVAGAIGSGLTIRGMDKDSVQADKAILKALQDAGAGINFQPSGITVGGDLQKNKRLKPFQFDATDCPDLFPPLVALASYCDGVSRIVGVQRLTHKESNRALTLQEEFAKMGVKIEIHENMMLIHGGQPLQGAVVHSRHDHRIAMATAVAALRAVGNTRIEEAQAIDKSYPDFFEDLASIGASIEKPRRSISIQ